MFSQVSDKQDLVTMTLFSRQETVSTYQQTMFKQSENVRQIVSSLSHQATAKGNNPPGFILVVNLIPKWEIADNGYDNADYKKLYAKFMQQVQQQFANTGVVIVGFYEDANLSSDEKAYLKGLKAGGSNADMMKTRAIIDSKGHPHLQLDTNTKIYSFEALYASTFAADTQQDGFNAIIYAPDYVGAHNKVVYTPEDSWLPAMLDKKYKKLCADNHSSDRHKHQDSNFIYCHAFLGALNDSKKHRRYAASLPTGVGASRYTHALLEKDAYHLTHIIVSAVFKSWEADSQPAMEDLDHLPVVKIGDATCDFRAFAYLVKKHTVRLIKHPPDSDTAKAALLKHSDADLDYKIMHRFYQSAMFNAEPDLLAKLARVFPDTKEGNELTQRLYHCTVKELHANPKKPNEFYAKQTSQSTTGLLFGVVDADKETRKPDLKKTSSTSSLRKK